MRKGKTKGEPEITLSVRLTRAEVANIEKAIECIAAVPMPRPTKAAFLRWATNKQATEIIKANSHESEG